MTRRLCSAPRNRAIFDIDIFPSKLLPSRILFKGSVIVKSLNKILIGKLSFLTLIWDFGGGVIWFSLNKSETVKAVTWHFAAFSNILLETFVPNLIFLTSPNLQILGKTQMGVFPISGQSLIKRNCNNSRTSDNDMKLRPVTKLDKKNKTMSKKIGNNVLSENCDVIAIFLVYSQFGAIWKLDSGCIVCKIYIFINRNLLSYKN